MNMSTPIINNGLTRSRLSVKGKTKTGVKGNNIYGHMAVGEESEDSENSSVYHEPYKLLPSGKQEYGCLLNKEALTSSKSGEYTGESRNANIFNNTLVSEHDYWTYSSNPGLLIHQC